MATIRVRAVAAGDTGGAYRNIGDVFDIDSTQFSDSTVSYVPAGNPAFPLFGWMVQVPSSTPLYSYAQANGGASAPRTSPRRTVL